MSFVIGDLVVDRYSKAANLKRKTFRVVHVDPMSGGMTVMNPYGKTKTTKYQWAYIELNTYENTLANRVTTARRDVERAQQKVDAAINNVNKFRADVSKARQWFPTV